MKGLVASNFRRIDKGLLFDIIIMIVSPVLLVLCGQLLNDQMIFFNLADLLKRYNVRTIVLGWPTKQKDIQEKITKFINNLNYIIEKDEITIEVVDEDYSSVESGEIVSDFKKNATSDTISAMIILERRLEKKKKEEKSE